MKNILKLGLTACLAAAFVFAGCKKDDDSKYSVTLSANNAEWGVVAGAGEYDEGTEITIMATASSGYHFQNWSDGDATNPRTLTVSKNLALIAVFAEGAASSQGGGQGTQQGGNTPQPAANGDILPKKVTKIVMTNSSEEVVDTYLFDTQGRIISDTETYRGKVEEENTFIYTDNTITWSEDGHSNRVFNIENGRIVSEVLTEGSGDYVYVYPTTYTYTSDGYLVSMVTTAEGKSTEEFIDEEKFTVTNGNITEYEGQYIDGDRKDEYKATVAFGDKPNNLNVDVTLFILDYSYLFSDYLGKRNMNLPTSMSEISTYTRNGKEPEKETHVEQYTYTYDGDYLTKITVAYRSKEYTYEIFYE